MRRIVWLNDRFVEPFRASLRIDDPGVRSGEGLFESMRARDGDIPHLERHLARLAASAQVLGLASLPSSIAVADACRQVAAQLPHGVGKIRATVTEGPTLLVEGHPVTDSSEPATAISLPGTWHPERMLAEHKTLSYLEWRHAQRQADSAGVTTALLLDPAGHLGEAASANLFCVVGDNVLTAPTRGLLPGITRSLVMEHRPVTETMLDQATWRNADELFLTSSVSLVRSVIQVDGAPIGTGSPGPVATALHAYLQSIS